MTRRSLLRAAGKAARKPKPGALEVCERHMSEDPNRCEGLAYEATGDEAKAIAESNEMCRSCRRPLARVLRRIAEVKEDAACSFCYRTHLDVAVAKKGFLGIPMEICEECARDAVAALAKSRGAGGELDDGGNDLDEESE